MRLYVVGLAIVVAGSAASVAGSLSQAPQYSIGGLLSAAPGLFCLLVAVGRDQKSCDKCGGIQWRDAP